MSKRECREAFDVEGENGPSTAEIVESGRGQDGGVGKDLDAIVA